MFDIGKKKHKTLNNDESLVDLYKLIPKGSVKWLNVERKKVRRKRKAEEEEEDKLKNFF